MLKTIYINERYILDIEFHTQSLQPSYSWRNREILSHSRLLQSGKPIVQEEGFYSGDSFVSNQTILDRSYYTIQDNKVYFKPNVKISYVSGKYQANQEVYFETDEEAKAFAEKIANRINHVKIEF